MSTIDKAETKLEQLCSHFAKNEKQIVSEEDAKIQLIMGMLTDVLGWPKETILAETHHPSGYSDYLLGGPSSAQLAIEAKRLQKFEIKVAEKNRMRPIKLDGNPMREAKDAISQVRKYADDCGLSLCAVTDGDAWIVFKAHVPGKNFVEAEGFVFPSLDAVSANFAEFYDLLSYEQVPKRIYAQLFDDVHNKRALLDQALHSPFSENKNRLKGKSSLGYDLERVFEVYFGKLRGDDDPNLLIDCFVETSKSRIADFSLEKIASKIIANISPNEKDIDENLSRLVANTIEIDEGQTVFIVGPSGSGKTTFVERFFRKTLAHSLRERCVDVRLSCLDAGGDPDRIVPWMTDRLVELFEEKLYENGYPSFDQLQGMYFGEYKRRAEGPWAALHKSDPDQFKVRFGDYLEETVLNDREGYLKKLLTDIVTNRHNLPVIIIDNIDEFPQTMKETLFQLTQALRRYVGHVMIIFPITDKSAWAFSKSDIFGIYPSVSYFLPTPSPRKVFGKRVSYLRQKLGEDSRAKEKATYQARKGIRVSIKDLNAFAGVLEEVFIADEFSAKTLGEISNYNIRRTLSLANRVITSPVFDVDALIASVISEQPLTTSFNRFLSALLKGDYEFYRQQNTHGIYPVFQVDNKIRQPPLLALRVLATLEAASIGGRDVEDRHLSVQSILDFFDTIGVSEAAISQVIDRLLASRLIEPFDMSVNDLSSNQMIAITHSGRIHLNLATRNRIFFEQMALTTEISDVVVSDAIRSIYNRSGPLDERLKEIRTRFSEYLISEDEVYVSTAPNHERYDHQKSVLERIRGFGQSVSPDDEGDDAVSSVAKKNLNAVVERVTRNKGFAFVSIDGIDGDVYLNLEVVQNASDQEIFVEDEIVCDIERQAKGLAVSHIHNISVPTNRIETRICEILRLFPDRHYGFALIDGKTENAFFPYLALSGDPKEGDIFEAEIVSDVKGVSWQVRRVIC